MPRLAVVTLLLAAATPRAGAEPPPPDQAVSLYQQGLRHYQLAEFAQAAEAFKASYRLAPDPELLFNIAQSYRRTGPDGCAPALEFYRNYRAAIAEAKRDPPATLDGHIADMERCVEAGRERASIRPAAAVARTSVGRPAERRSRWLELGLGTAGLAGAGLGAWLLVDARGRADDLWARCGSSCPPGDIDAVRLRSRLGAGLAVGGAATAAGALALWWLRGEPEDGAIAIVPWRRGLVVSGGF